MSRNLVKERAFLTLFFAGVAALVLYFAADGVRALGPASGDSGSLAMAAGGLFGVIVVALILVGRFRGWVPRGRSGGTPWRAVLVFGPIGYIAASLLGSGPTLLRIAVLAMLGGLFGTLAVATVTPIASHISQSDRRRASDNRKSNPERLSN